MAPHFDGNVWIKGSKGVLKEEQRQLRQNRRVAVIGSGMAGLTTAYLLDRSGFDVEVFESGAKPSLDAASVSIPCTRKDGEVIMERVDVPMRAFAGGYYPALIAMYKYFKIPFRPQQFLFTFSREKPLGKGNDCQNVGTSTENGLAYFIHSSNNHRFPPLRPAGRTWAEHLLEVLYVWAAYTYFTICCFFFPPGNRSSATSPFSPSPPSVDDGWGKTESLREYLARLHLPNYFTENYLLPLISSVATCPHEALLDFPASDITGYKRRMHKQPHYVTDGGIFQVQAKLLESSGIKVRFGRKVLRVERIPRRGGIIVKWEETAKEELVQLDDGEPVNGKMVFEKMFDQVVLAVNPYVVGKVYKRLEKEMSNIPCCEAEVLVHYDEKVVEDVLGRESEGFVDSKGDDEATSRDDIEEKDNEKEPTKLNSAKSTIIPQYLPTKTLTSLLRVNDYLIGTTSAQTIQLRTITLPITHTSSGNSKPQESRLTEATHIHPPGIFLTTSPLTPIPEEKILASTRFTRVLRTSKSRDVVARLFSKRERGYRDVDAGEKEGEGEWRNGDEGVWLAGSWCWDGMILLEGCVRSAMRIAKGLGAEIPWEKGVEWCDDDNEEGEGN